MRAEFDDWLTFLRAEAHLLSERPADLFQLAANQSDASAPGRRAGKLAYADSSPRPWLRWINKPQKRAPCLMTLTPGESRILAGSFLDTDQRAVSVSADGAIRLWDLRTGAEESRLRSGGGVISAACVSPDGSCAVLADYADEVLEVWDLARGVAWSSCEAGDRIRALGISSDGRRVVAGGDRGRLFVWEPGQCDPVPLGTEGMPIGAAAISGDGARALSAGYLSEIIILWDVASARELARFRGSAAALWIDAEGTRAVSAGYSGIAVWDLDQRTQLRSWPLRSPLSPRLIAVSSDGRKLAVATGSEAGARPILSQDEPLSTWNLESGEKAVVLHGHSRQVSAVAWSHDGRSLLSGSDDGSLKIWLPEPESRTGSEGHTSAVTRIAVSSTGTLAVTVAGFLERLATGIPDTEARVWDLITGELTASFAGHGTPVNDVALFPDGIRVVTAGNDATVRIWDRRDGTVSSVLRGHASGVTAVRVTPDGQWVASGAGVGRRFSDFSVLLWRPPETRPHFTLTGHTGLVEDLVFSRNRRLLISGAADGTARIWDLERGSPEAVLTCPGSVAALRLTEDDWLLAGTKNGAVAVWDLASGQQVHTINRFGGSFGGLALTPGKDAAIMATDQGDLAILDFRRGRELGRLAKHRKRIEAVAVSADGHLAATAAGDASIGVWRLEDGHLVSLFRGWSPFSAVAFTPDSLGLVAGDVSGRVLVLRLQGMSGRSR